MIKSSKHNAKKAIVINRLENKYEQADYKNSLFQPKKETRMDENRFKREMTNKLKILDTNKEKGYANRINNPYKGIIKKFDYSKKITNKDDLIVFYVKDEDKDVEIFKKNVKIYDNKIAEQNDYFKNDLYADDKKADHLKKFEYVKEFKYIETSDEGQNMEEVRIDRIEHYKKEETSNKPNNDILQDLIKSGAITEDLTNINYDLIDVDELEKKLMAEYGEDYLNYLG